MSCRQVNQCPPGLMNLITGLFGLIRNLIAHETKIKFAIEEDTALDLMILISYTINALTRHYDN